MEAVDYGAIRIVERAYQKNGPDVYTDYEIDEYLINFDYINIYIDQGVLDLKQVDQIFGWYVRSAWANPAVQGYLKRIRKKEPSVYINFETLAKRLKK
jgi:alpha-N-acetylglucosamine transferase